MSKAVHPRYLSGKALRKARVAAGLEQAELAAMVGATQGQISGWERGHTGCRLGTLHKLADALGCSPLELTPSDGEDDSEDAADPEGAAA